MGGIFWLLILGAGGLWRRGEAFDRGDGAGADGWLRLFHILCSQFLVTAVCPVRTLSWTIMWYDLYHIRQYPPSTYYCLEKADSGYRKSLSQPSDPAPGCWGSYLGVMEVVYAW